MRRAVCLMAAALGSLSCADSVSGPGALQLTVAVGQPVIALGDSTTVTIKLRNGGTAPITVTTGGCFILPYIARAAGGEVVYPSGGYWGCLAVMRSVTLAPGQSELLRYIVRGGASAPSPALAPGEYSLYATLESAEFPLRSAPARLHVVIPR